MVCQVGGFLRLFGYSEGDPHTDDGSLTQRLCDEPLTKTAYSLLESDDFYLVDFRTFS